VRKEKVKIIMLKGKEIYFNRKNPEEDTGSFLKYEL